MLTFFFAQVVHHRAAAGVPAGLAATPRKAAGQYVRGTAWFVVILAFMALLGGMRALFGNGPQFVVFVMVSLVPSPDCGGSPPGSCSWAK